ncbi:hypothetical protein [Primorskyibacter flagellatus]|uniref:Uncharacterized protein n=1 Tax=Primorskyibacter flagellatus TaxID=1387277 RepID=A0A1W2C7B3_9RHOB|nr:hypothetical protein [Primorskyibacter flagellatus]SMC81020.1 hypothetical protein SAMN06295998_106121 [Primorskyibacter flagellatus]
MFEFLNGMDVALRRLFLAIAATLTLAACADPLEQVGRLEDVDIAEDATMVEALPAPAESRPEGGFFSRFFEGGSAKGATQGGTVSNGQTLPYGEVGVLCGVSDRKLGKAIARHPERGRGYTLYDSAPGSTAPHSFYVTGFDDQCARQITGALVMFGSPSMHEQLRYGLPAESQPVSATDEAYETLKRRVCGAARGKPCGRGIARMEKNTVFVTIYENFASNPRWAELLLHDGELLAQGMKGR